jgi:hypothetical protein
VTGKGFQQASAYLPLLFNTRKGSAALLGFLRETEIATARWLVEAGALEEPTSTTQLKIKDNK